MNFEQEVMLITAGSFYSKENEKTYYNVTCLIGDDVYRCSTDKETYDKVKQAPSGTKAKALLKLVQFGKGTLVLQLEDIKLK